MITATISIFLGVGDAHAQEEIYRAVPMSTRAATPKSTPEIIVALPNYDEQTATRLQIFLDNNDFGPGKIDGKMGEFFRKALISYKHARGMRETGAVDQWLLNQVPIPFTTYTIRPDDLKFIGPVPSSHAAQAKLKWLPYTSLLEFVAERYHSAEAYIQKLNAGKNWEHLQPGESHLCRAQNFCRYQRALTRSLRQRSAGLCISNHAGFENVARTDRHLENPRRDHLALVSLR
jgi:hypothetical protein